MSLRYSSTRSTNGIRALALSAFLIGICASPAAHAAYGGTNVDPRLLPPVQNYAEQAVPVPGAPPPQAYYDSPLAAGTLTLQDVLEAHKPNAQSANLPAIGATPSATATAPILTPPTQESSTSLMMSQGMRASLQKVGETSVTSPTLMRPPSLNGQPVPGQPLAPLPAQAPGQPTSLLPAGGVAAAPGAQYQNGQEPKNLAGVQSTPLAPLAGSAVAPAATAPTAPATSVPLSGPSTETPAVAADAAAAAPAKSCDQKVQKWEKSCGDAGYPVNYAGKIVGETHTGCADGALHDVWVSNSCAPPETASAQTPGIDAVCGIASNNEFDDAPTSNLCAQGVASAVSGSGPWTWACSGINGGQATACTAHQHTAAANGVCGAANGVGANSAPSKDLCELGEASAIKGSGPWLWACHGVGGGSSQSCIAPLASAMPVTRIAPVVVEEKESTVAAPVSKTAAPLLTPAAVSEKGELCGAAAETLAYEAPDKDLCRIGTPGPVSGEGPWNWSCTDNDSRTSSCRTLSLNSEAAAAPALPPAPVAETASSKAAAAIAAAPPTPPAAAATPSAHAASEENPATPNAGEVACGAAAVESTMQAPTDDLCVNGKASAVHGSGPWHWTCLAKKGRRKVTCETPKTFDGKCGAANGAALKSAPFSGLCLMGTPTGIEGNGPWTWTCTGISGGVNVSCAASLQQAGKGSGKIDGTCGVTANTTVPAAPSNGLCATGTPSAVSGEGPWTWSCSGSNGGAVSSCAAIKTAATKAPGPLVNGLCGQANGVTAGTQPVEGLCAAGTLTSIVGNGPWNWSCLGENGGMTVSCTAPLEPPAPVDGVCGAASGVPTLVKPQSALCASGMTGSVSGRGPWTWTCSGVNGGSPASCVSPIAGKTGSMPSLTTVSKDTDVAAGVVPVAPAAPSSLVTPRLPSSTGTSIPALDRKALPRLTPSKGLTTPPVASVVPTAPAPESVELPGSAPELTAGTEPVQPPAIRENLPPAPVLQETLAERADNAARIPGNHLTLDPTISTVLFTRGSGNIDEPVITTLDKLAGVLQYNPDVRVTLTAFADVAGSTPRDARRLSLTRALAVRDYLVSKGVAESRVDVRAEGANTTSGYIDRVDVRVNE